MAESKKRRYLYGCRRDREPVGDLGRMSNYEYNKYIRDKSEDTLHKREFHNKDLRRLTEREYKENAREMDCARLLAYARYLNGGARERTGNNGKATI